MDSKIICDQKTEEKLKECNFKHKIKISGPDIHTFISEIAKAFNFKFISYVQDDLKDLDKRDYGFFHHKHNKDIFMMQGLYGKKISNTNLYDILIEILDIFNEIDHDFKYYIKFIDDKKFEFHQVYLKFDINEYNSYLEKEEKLSELYPCRFSDRYCEKHGERMPDGKILTCDNCRSYKKSLVSETGDKITEGNGLSYIRDWGDAPVSFNNDWK